MVAHSALTGADLHEPKGVATATSGQVYVANGSGSGAWTTQSIQDWTLLRKTSDLSRTNTTTLAADPDLGFAVAANKIYKFRGLIFIQSRTNPDFKYGITGPSSVNHLKGRTSYIMEAVGTLQSFVKASGTAINADMIGITSGTDAVPDGIVEVEFEVSTNANSGTVSFAWAQNSSNATAATVLAGSYIEYKDVTP